MANFFKTATGAYDTLKMAAGLAVLLLIIYVVWKTRKFLNSPAGKPLKDLLGAAGAALVALGNLGKGLSPLTLGILLVFGPAVLKLSAKAIRRFARRLSKANEKLETVKEGAARDAMAETVTHEINVNIRVEEAAARGNDPGAIEAQAAAQDAAAASAKEFAAQGFAEEVASGKEIAEEAAREEPIEEAHGLIEG